MTEFPPAPLELAGRRVLVTGVGGFIAAHLLPRLVECKAQVIAAAPDLGWRPWVQRLVQESKIAFIAADPLTPEGANRLIPCLKDVDDVVHLARVWAQGSTSLELAVDETARNLLGTVRFLSVAARYVPSILYPSSVEVYGTPECLPLAENHPLRPISPYAVAKAATEGFLTAHAARHGSALTILRYATVYGPGELEPRAIPNFIRAVLAGRPPVINGEGRDVRDYTHVADVTEATVRALASFREGVHIYNIGTGNGCSTDDLARLIIRLVGASLDPTYRSSPQLPVQIVCDISRARAELGYTPDFTLERGLISEIRWFRDNEVYWR